MVVNLHKKGKAKKGKVDYTTVTQVVVSMTPAECNVNDVATKVSEQVGFPTILLDSKCFALMKNDATSGIEFWKSTRKILAASASLWQQVSGHNIGTKLSVQVQGNADVHEDAGPAPKKQRLDNSETCQTVLEKVSKLEEKFTFLDELAQSLTCAICKTVSTLPVIFPCCQRVVGCESCINSWQVRVGVPYVTQVIRSVVDLG